MPKRIQPLTNIQVKSAKPKEKEYKLMDGYGLFMLVTPSSGKLWRFDYRIRDKRKTMAIGTYPVISLADARQRREDARKLLDNGIDPSDIKKAQKAAGKESAANSFEVVAREWHTKFINTWTADHADTVKTRLEQQVFPAIGARPIAEITPPELLKVLRRIESRGALDTARRVRAHCSQVFHYAVAAGLAERDIAADLAGVLPPVNRGHMAALTEPKDVAPLLRAIDDYKGSFVVKSAMQLAPLVFVRPGELRQAEWSEIDLEAEQWNIPAEKMKMKVAHLVPLSHQAVEILRELKAVTGNSRYVFPSLRSFHRCMSENAMNAAFRRMGFEKSEITSHGWRATFRTIGDEVLQFRPDIIEAQLAHAVRDANGRAYNRTSFLPERREMMQTWSNYLDGLKRGAEVISINQQVKNG